MIFYVDIDGTICYTQAGNYLDAKPLLEAILAINRLHNDGHKIIYWTSRGTSSGINHYDLTMSQLQQWGCRFECLLMGKPSYDVIIDDKSIQIKEIIRGNHNFR